VCELDAANVEAHVALALIELNAMTAPSIERGLQARPHEPHMRPARLCECMLRSRVQRRSVSHRTRGDRALAHRLAAALQRPIEYSERGRA
jgi:hypothetical protein